MAENFTDGINDMIKKVLLAGIGGAALSVEKAQTILDEMVKKGEITVEQGKALNQELKHSVKDFSEKTEKKEEKKEEPEEKEDTKTDVEDILKKLSPEDIAKLKEILNKTE